MDIEGRVPELSALILFYCHANNRGVLSAKTLQNLLPRVGILRIP
jgi:hypothetical protein